MGRTVSPFAPGDDAATRLTHEEMAGLIPSWVTFRHELNEVEQANIASGTLWAFGQRKPDLLDEAFLLNLHKQMLGRVWRWAGKYRTSARNIGVPAWQVPGDIRNLLEDARVWIGASVYEPGELAARFHHRLVAIHPFPNGNGRHSRLMADLLVVRLGGQRLTWGSAGLKAGHTTAAEIRTRYVAALRQAEAHDYSALLNFVRS